MEKKALVPLTDLEEKALVPLTGKKDDDEITFAVAKNDRRISDRRTSLFGLDENRSNTSPPAKTSKSGYENALLTECKQWDALIKQSVRHNASLVGAPMRLTLNDLTVEQRNYCDAAPDFRKFQADAERFADQATVYLQLMADFEKRKDSIKAHVLCELQQAAICAVRKNLPF